jgi:uncharacterized protein
MTKGLSTILLLVLSNIFMTFAWYGHLKFQQYSWFTKLGLIGIAFLSWGIALFEYMLMIPANRIGFVENGGPFTLWQLKIIQEVITLSVFLIFTTLLFKNEVLKWNHFAAIVCMVLAVYFMFKK